KVLGGRILRPICWSLLISLLDNLNGLDLVFGIPKLFKVFLPLRVVQSFSPLAEISSYQLLHLPLKICTDTQPVVNDHLSQVFNASWKFFNPSSCPLQSVRRSNIEDQITIYQRNDILRGHVLGKKLSMSRFCATI